MKTYRFLIPVISALLLTSCASKPVARDVSKSQGTWSAKAQIKNLKQNKSQVVNMDVIAIKDSAMRVEITATLGIPVASILLRDKQISYAVHTQKKFYSGDISEKALQPVMQIALNPNWLYVIFFDQEIKDRDWICEKNQEGLVEKCVNSKTNQQITWSERMGENKRILLKNSDFELNILVKDFTTKVEAQDQVFSLDIPANYKRYKLL